MRTFQLFKNGKSVIAPELLPYYLCQVVDVSANAGYDDIRVETPVPNGLNPVVFIRGRDNVIGWSNVTQYAGPNGKVMLRLRMHSSGYGGSSAPAPIRVYVFARYIVRIPRKGFFLYSNGALVWHASLLPLRLNIINRGDGFWPTINKRVAVMSFVSHSIAVPESSQIYLVDYFALASSSQPNSFGSYNVFTEVNVGWQQSYLNQRETVYIECDVYDQYYKQSLGVP